MARKRFILLSYDIRRKSVAEEFRNNLDRALDWIEVFPKQYLLWTSSSSSIWFARLKPIIDDGDHLFVCEIDPVKRAGRMPSALWSFMDSKIEKAKASSEL